MRFSTPIRLLAIAFFAVVMALTACSDSPKAGAADKKPTPNPGPAFKKEGSLTFFDQNSRDTLSVVDIEVAQTETEITQGLMWRRSMEERQAMLFIFPDEAMRSFWMKNTYIALDMVFVNQYQQIVTIRKDTPPLTLDSQPSMAPAKYVIELVSGFCDRAGVKEGDFVDFKVNP